MGNKRKKNMVELNLAEQLKACVDEIFASGSAITWVKMMLADKPFSLPIAEKEIAELILASYDNGILDVLSECRTHDGFEISVDDVTEMAKEHCFLCKLKNGSDRIYAVCFMKNPSELKNKPANEIFTERASRASEFVTDLLNEINLHYNCFIVPTNIGVPSCDVIKAKLNFPQEYEVKYVRESNLLPTQDDQRTYELEFVINASVGECYRKMNDCVAVKEKINADGKKEYIYEYRRETHTVLSETQAKDWRIDTEDQGLANILQAVQRPEEKRQILSAFAEAQDSEFSRFLKDLNEKTDSTVGQINLTPCSIFVGAIPQKTFIYSVTDPQNPYKSYEFSIVWNRPAHEFTKNTPLYVEYEDNRFVGLTCIKEYPDRHDPGVTHIREEFKNSDSLVLAFVKNEGHWNDKQITLKNIPASGKYPQMYKGVNAAIWIKNISPMLSSVCKEGYYLTSDVMTVRGEPILRDDVSVCPVSGQAYWNGDQTDQEVRYVSKNGKSVTLKNGKIFKDSCVPLYTRQCNYCSQTIYASADLWEKYRVAHQLRDGTSACDDCMKEGNRVYSRIDGFWRFYMFSSEIYDTEDKEKHPLFVKWDTSRDAPLKDGNAYRCEKCKTDVYLPQSSATPTHYDCSVCSSRLCPTCEQESKKEPKYLASGSRMCVCCLENPPELVAQGKRIYTVKGKEEQATLYVKDGSETLDTLFRCADCKSVLYYDPKLVYHACDCCGSLIGDDCWSKITPNPELDRKRLCSECRKATVTSEYNRTKSNLHTITSKFQEDKKSFAQKEREIKANWINTFMETADQYLPYMRTSDRRWLKRKLKKNMPAEDVVEISGLLCHYDAERSKGTGQAETSVQFSLRLKRPNAIEYTFINHYGRVMLGE